MIREVLHYKPGKVPQMAEKFRAISHALQEMGHEPMRLLTDVTGEPFWTIVAEAKVEKIDDFFAVEQKLTANESVGKAPRSPSSCAIADPSTMASASCGPFGSSVLRSSTPLVPLRTPASKTC